MKLIHKALLFRKLAGLPAEFTKEDYDKYIAGMHLIPTYQVFKFIRDNQNEPFFKIEDFFSIFESLVIPGLNSYTTVIQQLPRDIGINHKENIKKVATHLAYKEIGAIKPEDYTADEYLKLEKIREYISPEVLERAQRKLVFHLFRLSNEPSIVDGKKKTSFEKLCDEWEVLYSQSVRFSKHFLEKMAKSFGHIFYAREMDYVRGRDPAENKDIFNKEKYNSYDVAYFISAGNGGEISKERMLEIISKSDDGAKEYLKGLVYISLVPRYKIFMLDEEMKPMNKDYENIQWPDEIYPTRIARLSEEQEPIWRTMFSDFKRIPQ